MAAARPGAVVGPDRARRARASATASSKLGAALAPINPNFTEPEAIDGARDAHPAARGRAPRHRGAPPGRSPEPLGLPVIVTGTGVARRTRRATAAPRVGSSEDPCVVFLTSGSTGVSKGAVLSHRATWLRAIQRDDEGGATGRRGVVVMFGLFHMAGWYFLENAWAADRPVHLVAPTGTARAPRVPSSAGAPARIYCIPGVWQRILDDGGTYDTSSLVEVLTGTSLRDARPDRCAEGAVPGFVDVGRVRLHRDRARRRPPRLRPLRPAGQRRASRRRWWSPTSPTTASSGSAAPRCSPATSTGPTPPPTPSTTTAGSTPATSRRRDADGYLTHHRTPLGVDPLRRRVGRAGRGRERRPHPPVGRRRRGGGPPRPELGRSRVRGDRGTAGRDAPDRRRAAHARRPRSGRAQATARRGAGRGAPAHGRHRAGTPATPARHHRVELADLPVRVALLEEGAGAFLRVVGDRDLHAVALGQELGLVGATTTSDLRIARRVPRTASGALRFTTSAISHARSSSASGSTSSLTNPRS